MGDSGDSPCLPTRCRSRRIITRVMVFLLLGAIVNVAVAWGCAIWEPQPTSGYADVSADIHAIFANRGFQLPPYAEGPQGACRGLTFTTAVVEGDPANEIPDNLWVLTEAGWPLRCLAGVFHLVIETNQLPPLLSFHNAIEISPRFRARNALMPELAFVLPLRPIWPGFAINTIFYAAILWLLFAVPRPLRRWLRIKRHRCPACAYQIAPGTGAVCSECGAALPVRWSAKAS